MVPCFTRTGTLGARAHASIRQRRRQRGDDTTTAAATGTTIGRLAPPPYHTCRRRGIAHTRTPCRSLSSSARSRRNGIAIFFTRKFSTVFSYTPRYFSLFSVVLFVCSFFFHHFFTPRECRISFPRYVLIPRKIFPQTTSLRSHGWRKSAERSAHEPGEFSY